MSDTPTPAPQKIPLAKPQAVSHMLWFFVIPSLVFMGWASYRFVSAVMAPKPRDAFTKLAEIQESKTPGDRWQAAYGLTQALQQMSRDGEIEKLEPAKKEDLYAKLDDVLQKNTTDERLRKYLFLTLGRMGDPRGLPALERGTADASPDSRFYAAWGLVDIVTKHPEALEPRHIELMKGWLKNEDTSLRKVAGTFLSQQKKDPSALDLVEGQLKDEDREVRWNAAVALTTAGRTSGHAIVRDEILNIESLRKAGFTNAEDLSRVVAAAAEAVAKSGDASLKAAADKLAGQASGKTPEGRAIMMALARANQKAR